MTKTKDNSKVEPEKSQADVEAQINARMKGESTEVDQGPENPEKPVDVEAKIQERIESVGTPPEPVPEPNPNVREDWNIVPGKPLPEGFINPDIGTYGHLCIDHMGRYNPEWSQLIINQMEDHQRNPHTFNIPQEGKFNVHLNTWCDAHPGIIEAISSAIETT